MSQSSVKLLLNYVTSLAAVNASLLMQPAVSSIGSIIPVSQQMTKTAVKTSSKNVAVEANPTVQVNKQ